MNPELEKLIQKSRRIVFFGGAGVSTESGIPDFRSVDGLYHQKYDEPPEMILSHSYFIRYPEKFFRFYRDKILVEGAKPNAAHLRLAQLEREGRLNAVVTQTIAAHHSAPGSRNVYELHASGLGEQGMKCGRFYDVEFIRHSEGIPRCECGGIVKPDVVLYEESLDEETLVRSVRAIEEADLMIVGGTSLAVYPAAGLLRYFQGDDLVVINKTPTSADRSASLLIRDPIAKTLSLD